MENSGELNAKMSRESSLDNIPSLEDGETNSTSEKQHFICGICNEKFVSPKVLHCLHVFCTTCLEKSLEESGPSQIICHTCKQVTRLATAGGVNELPVDAVIVNLMEMEAISSLMVVCTSCKAQENAVARCSDCSNFLCPNCVTAHNYMRCFENHKVETFDELKNGKGIHKPMHCGVHPSEPFKFYCKTCQVLTCTECMVYLHKLPDHQCERVVDMEQKQREGLRQIISDAKAKISTFEDTSGKLESLLSELQQQRDNVQDLINETFQSYKASLEKRKDELLKELDTIHSKKELVIMEMFHSLETTGEKMDDACKFTERVVENADAVEMLSLNKVIRAQMKALHEEVPNSDLSIKIEVESDPEKFAEATKMYFCAFKKPGNQTGGSSTSSSACPLSSKTSPFDSQLGGVLQHSSAFDSDRFKLLEPATVAALTSGLNLSADLVSSLTANLAPPLLNDLASNIATSLAAAGGNGLSGLGQTLNFAERSLSRNSYSPTISDSGVSVDVSSSNSQQTLLQLQQLIKHGQIGLNTQGQITVNGHVIPGFQGLNWNMLSTSMPQSVVQNQVARNGGAGVSDSALASLLNSVSMSSNPLGGTTPSINELSALFSNLAPHQSLNLAGIQSTSPITASVPSSNLLAGPPPNLPLNGVFPVPSAGPSYSVPPPAGIRTRSGKTNSMEIRTKFGQLGPGKGQFNAPHGFCLGMDEDIVVADTNNHRIQVFEKNGEFKYQFGIPGRDEGQLWYPRKVAVIRTSGRYVVCDRGSERSRMQLFTRNGQFIKKIAIRYIDIVAGLAITSQGHIVAVDSVSPTVFCISESGELIKWFDCSDYMREPSDIAVSGKDYYVCDFKGHCVVVFNEDGQFLHRIGCDIITNYPNGIDISDAGDVLIGDSHGNRFHVAVFQRDGSLIGEFECPYVKVSRCCGLKITSEGYIVTLAKNNQHVLVLNTLYIA